MDALQYQVLALRVKLSLFNTVAHSIGYDRAYRRYWCFGTANTARLFVEDPDSHSLFCFDTAEVGIPGDTCDCVSDTRATGPDSPD